MNTRSLSFSLLALVTATALSACSADDPSGSAATGASASPGASASSRSAPSRSAAPAGSGVPNTSDGAAVVDNDAVLEIDDQKSEGPTVNVKAAAVTTGGWVVVAADGGRNVLGYGEVPAGSSPQLVQVSLAEIITKPTELTARLYDDANKDGFYGSGDKPVTNDDADDDDDVTAFAGELEVFSFTGADVINK